MTAACLRDDKRAASGATREDVAGLTSSCARFAITQPRVHTYSIVARAKATGRLGVAVLSHWFSIGPIVPWAEAGVGAVAMQSLADPAYGLLGLELVCRGKTAPDALRGLRQAMKAASSAKWP